VTPPLFGIAGWKNSGKTTLTARIVTELAKRGYKVATVKHAHHEFDVDQPGRDSHRFREAGAREVAVVSSMRVAIMHELRGEAEPSLAEIAGRLHGSDIILAEGFKTEPHPKLEVRRRDAKDTAALAGKVPNIVAIASDHPSETGDLSAFDINDIGGMTDFIIRYIGLDARP
jgi:molybdopterin-guanine dinucleotide biosynthesis adapter protein